MAVGEGRKKIARAAVAAFGGKMRVREYLDADEKSRVDILSCEDRPEKGMICYSTVGCHEFTLYNHEGEEVVDEERKLPLRVELVGTCASKYDFFPNALSTAAFCIGNSRWFAAPGAVFSDVFSTHNKKTKLKHMLFAPPFYWEDDLDNVLLPDVTVAWLLAVPITDAEMRFVGQKGTSADLEDIFEKKEVDIFDLARASVI